MSDSEISWENMPFCDLGKTLEARTVQKWVNQGKPSHFIGEPDLTLAQARQAGARTDQWRQAPARGARGRAGEEWPGAVRAGPLPGLQHGIA